MSKHNPVLSVALYYHSYDNPFVEVKRKNSKHQYTHKVYDFIDKLPDSFSYSHGVDFPHGRIEIFFNDLKCKDENGETANM